MKQKMLKPGMWLAKIDKRSGRTFEHFTHRIDLYDTKTAIDFLYWTQDNLGKGITWNLYLATRDEDGFEIPNWTVRYQEPGSRFTEVFVHPRLVSYIMLNWLP